MLGLGDGIPPSLVGKRWMLVVHWSRVEVPLGFLQEAISPKSGQRNTYSPQRINGVLSD